MVLVKTITGTVTAVNKAVIIQDIIHTQKITCTIKNRNENKTKVLSYYSRIRGSYSVLYENVKKNKKGLHKNKYGAHVIYVRA